MQPKLQFTLEKPDNQGSLAFLDLKVNVNPQKKVTNGWYQIPTDTTTVLNFRIRAPLQYKRNVIEGTVHRFTKSTSTWEKFNEALGANRKQRLDNHYPEKLSDGIVLRSIRNMIKRKKW